MSNIDYNFVDNFLSNFTNDTIPIRFVDYITLRYKTGEEKTIEGSKLRKMFPTHASTRHGVIYQQDDLIEMEVHIDKNLVYMYLLELDKVLRETINIAVAKIKKDR